MDALLKLSRKYSPGVDDATVRRIARESPHAFFLALMNEMPANPKARRDADKMTKLAHDAK